MPSLNRMVVTGSGGLYGQALLGEIRKNHPHIHVLGVDVGTHHAIKPDVLCHYDIREERATQAIVDYAPDAIIHLAYAVQPQRNQKQMRSINIDGTRAVLAAAAACQPKQLLVASSGTVYGARPQAGGGYAEDAPLRPSPQYYYARDKGVVESDVASFAHIHTDIAVAITRPAIICSPQAKNFLLDIFLTVPFLVLPDGRDTALQFIHAEDVARGTMAILMHAGRGPYNLTPEDSLTQTQLARAMGIPAIRMPSSMLMSIAWVWWALHLPWVSVPPGLVSYMCYPWLMTGNRLHNECGFSCNHSSAEAFQSLLMTDETMSAHTR